ncbi:3'-5' exonuclease, partial [Streptococcus suis]
NLTVTQVVEAVLNQTGYIDALAAQNTLEANARIENIQEFLSVTKNFDEKDAEEEETGLDRLTRFLLDLALIADTDDGDTESSEVTLMTLHAA